MQLLNIVFCCLLILVLGILFEYLLHPDYSVTQCARSLREAICGVLVGFFSNSTRHTFDDSLDSGFAKIIAEYKNPAFEPSFKASFIQKIPCIILEFISTDILSEEDLNKISRLIRLKFSHYLSSYGFSWEFFTEYHTKDNAVKLIVFYSELKEDRELFLKRYRQVVRLKSTPEHGVLRDDSLDRELRHAH